MAHRRTMVARARAQRRAGVQTGVGGTSWTPESVTGAGESSAVTAADGTAITGHLYQENRPAQQGSGPGVAVGVARWVFVVVDGTAPASGTVLTSDDDGRRVRLGAPIADVLYPSFEAEAL